MAYFDDPIVDPTLDFDAQDLQLQQQLARVKALRAVGATTPDTPTNEVGGWTLSTGQKMPGRVIRTPTAALLNPLLANVGADIGDARSTQMKSDISRNQQADMVATLAATPQATPAKPSTELMGPTPDGKPLMSDAIPAQEPTRADILAHGAQLAKNPLTRAIAQKYIEDQLVGAPTREATQRLELTKAAMASKDKALDRQSRLDAARIRANATGGAKLTMVQNDNGVVTGGYDPRTNQTYPLGTLPGGTAALDTDGPALKESDVGSNPAKTTTTGAVAPPTNAVSNNGVVGKKSGAVLKAEAADEAKIAETNDALDMIHQARAPLQNTSYGFRRLAEGGHHGHHGPACQPEADECCPVGHHFREPRFQVPARPGHHLGHRAQAVR